MPRKKNEETESKAATRVRCVAMKEQGLSANEIAAVLGVHVKTVYVYLRDLRNKVRCDKCNAPAEYINEKKGVALCRACFCPDVPVELQPWSGVSCTCCTQ